MAKTATKRCKTDNEAGKKSLRQEALHESCGKAAKTAKAAKAATKKPAKKPRCTSTC